MKTFEINEKGYIELNKLLKVMNLVETGGEAHIRIESGEVKVNGAIERQKRKKLRPGDIIVIDKEKVQIKQSDTAASS
jgi:ribosome-associated protein